MLELGQLDQATLDATCLLRVGFEGLLNALLGFISWPTPVHDAHDEDGENSHQPRLGTKLASGPQLIGRFDFQDGAHGLAAADCESVDGSLEKIPSDVQTNRNTEKRCQVRMALPPGSQRLRSCGLFELCDGLLSWFV